MKKVIIFLFCIIMPFSSFSQVHNVFIEDTNCYYFNNLYPELKEKLPDGKWMFYFTSKNDSSKNINKYLIAEGCYSDSLRTGPFYNYGTNNKMGKDYIEMTNYTKGKADGIWYIKMLNTITEQGYFNNGKKNGFFIKKENEANYGIQFYENDSLLKTSSYVNNLLYSKTEINNTSRVVNYYLFGVSGQLVFKSNISNNKFGDYYVFWENGNIKTHVSGEFESITYSYYLEETRKLINGFIKNYNQDGHLLSEEIIK